MSNAYIIFSYFLNKHHKDKQITKMSFYNINKNVSKASVIITLRNT